MPSVAIVGPGAVGSAVATMLHQQGHAVQLCARRAIDEVRLQYDGMEIVWTPQVLLDPASAPAVDWVLVCTKAYDAATAAHWLPALCRSGAPVAILQNGVEHRERFAGVVPDDRLVPVMVDLPAERDAGVVRQRGLAKMAVADNELGQRFAHLFSGTTAAITLTSDLRTALWRKLCVNAAGVIPAIVDRPGGVMRRREAAELARRILAEVVAVGRAEGANLPDSVIDDVLNACQAAPADGINSLHADRRAGRRTEIDARNGVIVRLGAKFGIATPYNEMAVTLIGLCRNAAD